MNGFSGDWLALREPADRRARAAAFDAPLAAWLPAHRAVRVLDLGCGTGANLRWLAPRLGRPQAWHLLDRDAALLDRVPERLRAWAARSGEPVSAAGGALQVARRLRVTWQCRDLADGPLPLAGHDLVTASALLDLVSRDWLAGLAAAGGRAALLLALSYDGRMAFSPRDPRDAPVRDAINRHQRRDKGLGPALGPDAAAAATSLLRAAGYRVVQARSDWRLDARDAGMQSALLADWARAAREAGLPGPAVDGWHALRLRHLERGAGRVRVGHVDLLALPRRGA